MKEFLLIFRRDLSNQEPNPSPEQLQAMMKPWQDWMGGLAAQNKLVSSGNRLAPDGKVLKEDNLITDGPYVELKESVGGYIIIRAESLEEAALLSNGCPMFKVGGNVEVREIIPM
jgi:hypothetical protein